MCLLKKVFLFFSKFAKVGKPLSCQIKKNSFFKSTFFKICHEVLFQKGAN